MLDFQRQGPLTCPKDYNPYSIGVPLWPFFLEAPHAHRGYTLQGQPGCCQQLLQLRHALLLAGKENLRAHDLAYFTKILGYSRTSSGGTAACSPCSLSNLKTEASNLKASPIPYFPPRRLGRWMAPENARLLPTFADLLPLTHVQ